MRGNSGLKRMGLADLMGGARNVRVVMVHGKEKHREEEVERKYD